MIGPVRMEPEAIEEAGWTSTDQLVLLVPLYLWGCCMENSFFRNEGVGGASYTRTRVLSMYYLPYEYTTTNNYYYSTSLLIIIIIIIIIIYYQDSNCYSSPSHWHFLPLLCSNLPYSMG